MTTEKRPKKEASRFLKELVGPLTFAKALQSTRLADELSQAQCALMLGISRAHLCDIEKGRRMVSPARAAQFAKRLGYHPLQWAQIAAEDWLKHEGFRGSVTIEAAMGGAKGA